MVASWPASYVDRYCSIAWSRERRRARLRDDRAAIVATSPTHIPGGLGLAVALQVPILTMIDISASWLHFRDLDFAAIKVLLPVSFLGMALGQWLDKRLSDSNAWLLVGLLLLIILAVELFESKESLADQLSSKEQQKDESLMRAESGSYEQKYTGHHSTLNHRRHGKSSPLSPGCPDDSNRRVDEPRIHSTLQSRKKVVLSENAKLILAVVIGIIGGVASMLTNAMGPILNVYLLSVEKMPPSAYVGTRAIFFCFINCGKLPIRFYAGTLGWQMMPLAVLLGLVSVLGVIGAKPIMLSMTEANFVRLELVVVGFSAIRLCWMGCFAA